MMSENDKKGFLQSGMFYLDHLDARNGKDMAVIEDFRIASETGYGLQRYLQEYACEDEADGNMRTYLVRYAKTDECVGYFSLKAGLVSLNETEREVWDKETGQERSLREFDTIPGVELAYFAVNSSFVEQYPFCIAI